MSARNAYLVRRYGITEKQFKDLLRSQGFSCPVCQRKFKEIRGRPHVDHNHKTSEIRGILCGNCNHRVVGRHTDAALLRRAADYLDTFKTGWFVPKRKRKRHVNPRRT